MRRKQDKSELERLKRKVREEEKREERNTVKQKSRRLDVENDCILKNEKQDMKGSKEYKEKQSKCPGKNACEVNIHWY